MKDYLTTDLSISASVIESILARTIAEVEGVAGFRKKSRKKPALDVENTEEGVVINLRIAVFYGYKISEIAQNTRTEVTNAIEESIGIDVCAVNIFVDEVIFSE